MTRAEFANIFMEMGITPIITNYEYDEESLPVIHMVNHSINASVDLMFKVSQFNLLCDGEGFPYENDQIFAGVSDYFTALYPNVVIDPFLYMGFVITNDQQPPVFVPFIKYTDDGYVRIGMQTTIVWSTPIE